MGQVWEVRSETLRVKGLWTLGTINNGCAVSIWVRSGDIEVNTAISNSEQAFGTVCFGTKGNHGSKGDRSTVKTYLGISRRARTLRSTIFTLLRSGVRLVDKNILHFVCRPFLRLANSTDQFICRMS